MVEYFTKGVVLDRIPRGESDEAIVLFTKDLGKVIARVTSAKHINSKLSPHLGVGRLVRVRLIKKNSYKIVDVLSERVEMTPEVLKFLDFVAKMTPYETQDLHLWNGLEYVLEKEVLKTDPEMRERVYGRFLEIMGFGSKFAKCHDCEKGEATYFSPRDIIFLCYESISKLKISQNEVIKIASRV